MTDTDRAVPFVLLENQHLVRLAIGDQKRCVGGDQFPAPHFLHRANIAATGESWRSPVEVVSGSSNEQAVVLRKSRHKPRLCNNWCSPSDNSFSIIGVPPLLAETYKFEAHDAGQMPTSAAVSSVGWRTVQIGFECVAH